MFSGEKYEPSVRVFSPNKISSSCLLFSNSILFLPFLHEYFDSWEWKISGHLVRQIKQMSKSPKYAKYLLLARMWVYYTLGNGIYFRQRRNGRICYAPYNLVSKSDLGRGLGFNMRHQSANWI